jgi:hypothetical protein
MINSSWITGSATFPSLEQCLEAKEIILQYEVVNKKAYIECRLVEAKDDRIYTRFTARFFKKDMERQITKG